MDVSAVIPTHNCIDYLPACLDSVLAQTVRPDEIIVVDDGSTDGTAEMLRQLYPQVRCIRQQNAGAAAARNTGIEAAQHELVAFGDADDLWHPRRLECQLGAFQEEPDIDLVGCVMLGIDSDQTAIEWPRVDCGELLTVDIGLAFRWGGGVPVPTWLVRREIFERVGLLDTDLPVAEDLEILLRVLSASCRAGTLRQKLYAYRKRPDSLSASSGPEYAIHHYRVLARYRPDPGGPSTGLNEDAYWEMVPPWLIKESLSAISHGRWDYAREILAEIERCPGRFESGAIRKVCVLHQIVSRVRSPVAERMISRIVRASSLITRQLRRSLAERGRRQVLTDYSVQNIGEKMLSALREIIATHRRAAG